VDTIDDGTGKRQLSQADEGEAPGTGVRKRRRYGLAYKRQVVEETLKGEDSVSIVARRHDLNANMLFNWRQAYLAGKYDQDAGSSLIPITVSSATDESTPIRSGAERLEIVLSGGHCVVVEGSVDPAVLRTALEVLAR
jgi:transposase